MSEDGENLSWQRQYWLLLWDLKTGSKYLEKYHQQEELVHRCLNILITVASSGSILAMIILKVMPFLWLSFWLFVKLLISLFHIYRIKNA